MPLKCSNNVQKPIKKLSKQIQRKISVQACKLFKLHVHVPSHVDLKCSLDVSSSLLRSRTNELRLRVHVPSYDQDLIKTDDNGDE